MSHISRRLKALLGIALILNLFVWGVIYIKSQQVKFLEISHLDVGQGDATLIEVPGGLQVLVDAGRGKDVIYELQKQMPFFDRSIDVVIATHPDLDHIGGLPAVLERYKVDVYLEPGIVVDSEVKERVHELLAKQDTHIITARAGQQISLGEGARLEILFPDQDVSDWSANEASVISKLVYVEVEILLTGDSSKEIEEYLVRSYGDQLDVDLLKVGHHGSDTSTSELLLGVATPSFAVISAGADNHYGHPHQSVTDLLTQYKAEILETAKEGPITFLSDGLDLWRVQN